MAPGRGHQLGQVGREPPGVVGGLAGPQVEGGLVDPDGDDDDGLVAEPAPAQLGFQPGQQPLGGVAGDAQVEYGVGREGGVAQGMVAYFLAVVAAATGQRSQVMGTRGSGV